MGKHKQIKVRFRERIKTRGFRIGNINTKPKKHSANSGEFREAMETQTETNTSDHLTQLTLQDISAMTSGYALINMYLFQFDYKKGQKTGFHIK